MADVPSIPSQRPKSDREDALAVLRRLREAGHVAYFAGGCVRDQLLGLEPKDWDVAADAPPDRVRQLFSNTQAVGAAFGVILVKHRKSTIEVATFRTDLEYKDGRRPEGVRFATSEEDAKRRDFTINGLFQDPIEDRIIDYVGGQADLNDRVLRAIGNPDARFAEDHLRLLRAIRFAARFELMIEPATSVAIGRHAPHLIRISPERIADELRRILTGPNRNWAWDQMLLRYPAMADTIFRFLPPPPRDRESLGLLYPGPSGPPWPFALGLAAISLEWALLQSGSRDVRPLLTPAMIQRMVRALRQSLRISNEEADQMQGTLEGVAILLNEHPPRVSVAKRFLARETAPLSRRLLVSLARFLGVEPKVAKIRIDELGQMFDGLARTDYAPVALITGDDLTAAGLKPGPVFKRVLERVYDAQLEDRVRSKEDAIALAIEIAREGAGTPGPPDRR